MKYDWSRFKRGLEELEIELSSTQFEKFEKYYDMLIEKNKVMNLTSITELDDVITKHFLDSLSIVMAVEPEDISNLIDVGTGAGFPGIPIKIAFPEINVTLADSLAKRVDFLNDVIKELGLKNIKAVHGRAEDLAHDKAYREKFDVCVSRAVASLPVLSEYCLGFVCIGGIFIAYKAQNADSEARKSENAVEALGGVMADAVLFDLPDSEMERTLIVIEKEEHTPARYPRKAGIPDKKPLN